VKKAQDGFLRVAIRLGADVRAGIGDGGEFRVMVEDHASSAAGGVDGDFKLVVKVV
jgi:hypothetical protein